MGVPTIYRAYVRDYPPQNMALHGVQYLHKLDPEITIELMTDWYPSYPILFFLQLNPYSL